MFEDSSRHLHGFLDTGGSFSTIDVPGAEDLTWPWGINDRGQIVGDFWDGTNYHGLLDSGGSFTTIDVPGASYGTHSYGINDRGQIVGSFQSIPRLMDFARLVEVFDRHGVTFVSVTQSFNTTTSMGRLTLNILLSFAQFEREVIGERIRDKFAASRKRGMWMGGFVPMGYDVLNRKLLVNDAEAATVRMIFERFARIGSATTLVKALVAEGVRNKRGKPIDKGFLYKLLNNRIYLGEAVHKGTSYPGEHAAIVDQALWDKVHSIMQVSPPGRPAPATGHRPC